jgi:hypothetical protein
MKYAGFYVNKFMSFHHLPFNIHRQVDIMLLVDDIHTLVNIVITDPTQANLVSHVVSSCGVASIVAIHAKEGLYFE